MDPRRSGQDVIRCELCKENVGEMYCDFCHIRLCIPCIGSHIANGYDNHKVVPFQKRKSTLVYTRCTIHENKRNKFKCVECNVCLCSLCVSSNSHKGHDLVHLSQVNLTTKQSVRKDERELKNIISPTYDAIVSELESKVAGLDNAYDEVIFSIIQHGEKLHKEVDNVIGNMKNELNEMKNSHLDILKKKLDGVVQQRNSIQQGMRYLWEIEQSNEIMEIMEYKSRIEEFRQLPPKVQITLPTFNAKSINTEDMRNIFGFLTRFSSALDEQGYTLKRKQPEIKEFLNEEELVTTFITELEGLNSIAVVENENIWINRKASDMNCFDSEGRLTKTIHSSTGEIPNDITVTEDGDILYTDWKSSSINVVKNGTANIEEKITLHGWIPVNLCVTFFNDLLVSMYKEDGSESKVVRYTDFVEKQTIQYGDNGQQLLSANNFIKYLAENRNRDICVADNGANAVVVVAQSGRLRFQYKGQPQISPNQQQFHPFGIATDSQSHILTSDSDNHCIHIIDADGNFLRHLNSFSDPWGICVDENDILYVAELITGNVKKIKYLK
uniref:B box-type domain-containing protein n=1 Tax=Magallana gigas TaxID=29159 RepID=A0A8W8LTD5_MAGGI